MKCQFKVDGKECGKECNGLVGLSNHIAQAHKNQITVKEYYDKYFKKEGEGICLGINHIGIKCKEETTFININIGYLKYCSPKCARNNKEIQEKIKQTWNKKSDSELEKINDKKIETLKRNYGPKGLANSIITEKKKKTIQEENEKNPNRPEEIQEKIKYTNDIKNAEDPDRPKKILEKMRLSYQDHYGEDNPMKCKEVVNKLNKINQEKNKKDPNRPKEIKERTRLTNQRNRSTNYPTECKKVRNKVKLTRIKNGNQIPDDQLSHWRIYQRSVYYFTHISLKKKYSKEELGKRKLAGTKNGLHADHRFTVFEGFKQNILPCIIGCQSNLELLIWEANLEKQSKCSITKEQLFELYEQEIKEEYVKN